MPEAIGSDRKGCYCVGVIYSKTNEYSDDSPHEPLLENVLSYLSSGHVLDIGAGTGRDAIFLAQKGFSVTALDNDEVHQKLLKKKASELGLDMQFVLADILDYRPEIAYDIVISDMVLHFFAAEQIEELVQRMQDWTKPNGINIVIAYSDQNLPGKRPYLFKHNELKDYYADWDIVVYEEKPTPWFQHPDEPKPRRNHAVYLLARKSS